MAVIRPSGWPPEFVRISKTAGMAVIRFPGWPPELVWMNENVGMDELRDRVQLWSSSVSAIIFIMP